MSNCIKSIMPRKYTRGKADSRIRKQLPDDLVDELLELTLAEQKSYLCAICPQFGQLLKITSSQLRDHIDECDNIDDAVFILEQPENTTETNPLVKEMREYFRRETIDVTLAGVFSFNTLRFARDQRRSRERKRKRVAAVAADMEMLGKCARLDVHDGVEVVILN